METSEPNTMKLNNIIRKLITLELSNLNTKKYNEVDMIQKIRSIIEKEVNK